MSGPPVQADLLISGATLITMDAERRVIEDAALAIAGDRIVAVGKREALARQVSARETIDGRRFVITPGFVDGHIHITGDPITRGFARGAPEDSWSDKLQRWVIPIFRAQTAEEERIAAQVAALSMIRYGTTTFVEAGTVIQLDAVMDGLAETGIRGRVGQWVEGRAYSPDDDQAALSAAAIGLLEDEVERYPDRGEDSRLAAWPLLVGHSTNSDDVWRAAKALADQHGLRVSAHMSPRSGDPEWFLAKYNRRPLEHLADIEVLGESVMLTHLADIDESELDLLVESGAGAIHCPHAALQGGFGVAHIGRFPEMLDRGVNLMLGTDGLAADILASGRLMASLFRDARRNQDLIPATTILEMATLNAARALGWSSFIGSLEVGKKADFVLHDTDLPEWGTVFDAVGQLALSAPSSGVHSAWIDGVRVLEAGHATLIDEPKLLADARQAGRAVIARTRLPNRTPWPVS
ncbi:MAG: amidohydrolase family protein [Phenylobacterium sp.]|jgi:5-methylthioadenosine/S-adenosylhomocysteine deaminase|uniref:amidohydrolase family protein n=1 Tax=Phenylobacterium sp. TaxID=1871053 RepID=UPI002622C6BF|nr:amidohydrolase family protein [Phenylobacterium sp.]MDB5427486.1 amidohydrolase family protein [Phenylobacterium sp.]MDB5436638.1 amidohydrolase family protein [Phenylobacterium sp.]MDB5461817.1 amidohydrolase family protein [Phenylobacterium sp.]MDB5496119.1 amidohydrolase family protein [Phenylobacterium sp.]